MVQDEITMCPTCFVILLCAHGRDVFVISPCATCFCVIMCPPVHVLCYQNVLIESTCYVFSLLALGCQAVCYNYVVMDLTCFCVIDDAYMRCLTLVSELKHYCQNRSFPASATNKQRICELLPQVFYVLYRNNAEMLCKSQPPVPVQRKP